MPPSFLLTRASYACLPSRLSLNAGVPSLTRAAVEHFFGCRAVVGMDGKQAVPAEGEACAHRRPISVTTSRGENPPSWAVLK